MSMDETRPEPNILLVEDNPIDVLMIKRALRNSGFKNQPIVLDDGGPALAFLGERINLEGGALPDGERVGDAEGKDGVDLERVQVALPLVDLGGEVGLRRGVGGHIYARCAIIRRIRLIGAGHTCQAHID